MSGYQGNLDTVKQQLMEGFWPMSDTLQQNPHLCSSLEIVLDFSATLGSRITHKTKINFIIIFH